MKRIYLVRHGRTDWNREEIFRGRMDVPLDEAGRRQAEMVRAFLAMTSASRKESIARVISSPLSRAVQTATAIAGGFEGVPLEREDAFTDIDVGDWGGLPLSTVEREFPEQYRLWLDRPDEMRFPSGESLEDVRRRAWAKLAETLKTGFSPVDGCENQAICVVSHRVVLKVLLLTALGLPLKSFWKIRVDTGSVSILEVGGKTGDEVTVAGMNITSHLLGQGLPGENRDF